MVSLMQLIAHFAIPVPISLTSSPNRLKIEKLEEDLRLFGEFWPPKLQEHLFPGTKFLIVPALDARSQILSILDGRNGVEKPVFKLAPPGHDQPFDLAAPDLCVPRIPDDALRQVISQASQLAQKSAAYV